MNAGKGRISQPKHPASSIEPLTSRFTFHVSRLLVHLLLVSIPILVAACGTLEIGLEPTPTPTPSLLRYENTDYGFAFTYPSHWTLETEPHITWLRKGTLALRIAHKSVDEAAPLPLPDMAATDGSAYVGKLTFMGQVIPAEASMYDRKMKSVVYRIPQPETSDDPILSIFLKDIAGDETVEAYEQVDIPDAVVAEVNVIVESFERVPALRTPSPSPAPTTPPAPPATPTPPADAYPGWARYVNADYGFAFRYPVAWDLVQVPGGRETPFGPSADAVHLRRDDLLLQIQVQRAGDNHFLGGGEVAAGDLEERGPVMFMGEPVSKTVLVFADEDKRLSLRYKNDALEFYIVLSVDVEADIPYERIILPDAVQAEVDQILRSFE